MSGHSAFLGAALFIRVGQLDRALLVGAAWRPVRHHPHRDGLGPHQ